MKLKEFIVNLNTLVDENPDALEMYVITSNDEDEYTAVHYLPSLGHFDDNEWLTEGEIEQQSSDDTPLPLNTVLLN